MIGARVANGAGGGGPPRSCAACAIPSVPRGRLRGCRLVHLDFAGLGDAAKLMPLLAGVDVVINAVGIFSDATGNDFRRLHTEAPIALFKAAVAAGVRRIVQISALGAGCARATPVSPQQARRRRSAARAAGFVVDRAAVARCSHPRAAARAFSPRGDAAGRAAARSGRAAHSAGSYRRCRRAGRAGAPGLPAGDTPNGSAAPTTPTTRRRGRRPGSR